jgi:hypothetical protein
MACTFVFFCCVGLLDLSEKAILGGDDLHVTRYLYGRRGVDSVNDRSV